MNASNLEKSLFKGRKILITGGLGFIGSSAADKFLSHGATVTLVDNLDPNCGGNKNNIKLNREGLDLVQSDIQDIGLLKPLIEKSDIIVNCAAISSHSGSMKNPETNFRVNCIAVLNILETLRNYANKKRFIQIGTTTQFGSVESKADESYAQEPLEIYSAHKMLAEKYVNIYAETYGLNAYCLRFPNVYGPRAAIHTPALSFNNYFVGLALKNQPITIFGNGKQLRNFLFIDDAINAIFSTIGKNNISGECFLATHDEHLSVNNYAEKVIEIFGQGSITFIDWKEENQKLDIGDANYNNQKLKKTTGWSPIFDLDTGLSLTHNYFKTRKNLYL